MNVLVHIPMEDYRIFKSLFLGNPAQRKNSKKVRKEV